MYLCIYVFIVCVHAVLPPYTHDEARMQQGPKRRMRIPGLFHARLCVCVCVCVRARVRVHARAHARVHVVRV